MVGLSQLIGDLEKGAVCLTGTARLARFLSGSYAREQQARGLSRWPTPQIFILPAWLDRLASVHALTEQGPATVWLSPTQETLLWRQVIESSPQAESILNLEQAALQASRTWAEIAEWKLPLRSPEWELLDDTAVFRQWAREFFRRCRDLGVHSRAQLPDAIIDAFTQGQIAVPQTIYLAGMLDRTPRQTALFDALSNAGSRIIEHDSPSLSNSPRTLASYSSPAAEMRAAAGWALQRLRENPGQRLAIIVPDLAPVRDQWEAVFSRVFPRPNSTTGSPPYHFSLGRPLSHAGIVQCALHLAELTEPRLSQETAHALLLSPYIGGAREERVARSCHSLQLLARGGSVIPIAELASVATPVLARRLLEWEATCRELPAQLPPSHWARQFSVLFRQFGWPGVELDSTEFQMLDSMREVLSELASLDAIAGPINSRQAAAHLSAIASEHLFQIEDLGEPLQLLGAFEALGERFDAAWLAGFHDHAWPPQSQPLALAPISLQRSARLPRAVPELWLERSRAAIRLLYETAPELTISYARADGDEPLLPSPLISGNFDPVQDTPLAVHGNAPVEYLDDWRAPAYAGNEFKGGASLLRDHAHCPFRSFAAHRLGAQEFPESELGLSAQQRGVILHAAIANVWDQLKDLATLKATSADQLAEIIRVSVRRAIQDSSEALAEPFHLCVREVEQKRLERLLALWMNVERGREANFTVIGSESRRRVEIGGLSLTIRYDRQDRLDDGRLVLIDYKSNAPSPAKWDGDRPDEPQVPLYAIAADKPIAALAFAQLKRSDSRFKGVADDAGVLPKAKAAEVPIVQLVASWRPTLERLARDCREGIAPVDPKSATICERCHLPALCRIHEAPPPPEEDHDDCA